MSNYKKRVKHLRRFGSDMLGFTTKKMNKRKNKPGEHPFFVSNKTAVKESFLNKLQSKQKLKLLFCINERQLRNYLNLVVSLKTGDPIVLLYNILNLRFDFLIYNNHLAKTILQARQLIVHGLVKLNESRNKNPGHICNIGDILRTTSDIAVDNIITYNAHRVTFQEAEAIDNNTLILKICKPKFVDINILTLIQESFEYYL